MANVPGVLYIGDPHSQGGDIQDAIRGSLAEDTDNLTIGSPTPTSQLEYLLDRDSWQITPHRVGGDAYPVASGAHVWFDHSAMSGNVHKVESSTTTSVTLLTNDVVSGLYSSKILSFINDTNAIFSGTFFDQTVSCTGNTDQVFFFGALSVAPPIAQGFRAGIGRFMDYHPVGGFLNTTEALNGDVSHRGGSAVQQGGAGVGPDAAFMPDFFSKVWPTAPYFHCMKYANGSTVDETWADSPNDSARANFLLNFDRAEVAATERGNVIVWDVCIIDQSTMSLTLGTSQEKIDRLFTYETRLTEMIAWVRSAAVTNNPDLKIILINHRSDMWATTGSLSGSLGAPFYRGYHKNIARTDGNVGIVDMEGRRVGVAKVNPDDEMRYYAQAEYLYMGSEIVKTYQRMALGTATDQTGGFPLYFYIGDSIAVGQIVSSWTTTSVNIELTGVTPGDLTRPSNQLTWNRGTGVLEIYKPHTNSNTQGSVTGSASSDLSITAALGKLHPNGFALLHRGSSSSALHTSLGAFTGEAGYESGGVWRTDAGEHMPELINDFAACASYINNTLAKQVDVRGAFVVLGHNDAAASAGGGFASAIGGFCDDLNANFNNRTDGTRLPIIWRRPQIDANGGTLDLAEITAVRSSIESLNAGQPWFRMLDVDGKLRDHTDDLHEAPATAVENGYEFVALLSGIIL